MMQGSVRNVFSLTANRALQTALVLISAAGLITGCGSNSHTGSAGSGDGSGPTAGEETTVALQVSSTANDSLFGFNIALQSISLTNAAGKTVTIGSTASTPRTQTFTVAADSSTKFQHVSAFTDRHRGAKMRALCLGIGIPSAFRSRARLI